MTGKVRKALIGALAAWTFAAGVMTGATPTLAGGWHGGWYGGWRGGYWGGCGWGCGYNNWGGAVAAGVVGGLALGALAGAAISYGPYYYGSCSWQNRPVYDSWGNFAGYAPVQVCY
ncbi:MAG TPA: hypothetical protein VKE72_05315 [Methylocella sp.]|nr:hypothetical protein [Methylocella sp.]